MGQPSRLVQAFRPHILGHRQVRVANLHGNTKAASRSLFFDDTKSHQ